MIFSHYKLGPKIHPSKFKSKEDTKMSSGMQWAQDQLESDQYETERLQGKMILLELNSMSDHAVFEYFHDMLFCLKDMDEMSITYRQRKQLEELKLLLNRVYLAK